MLFGTCSVNINYAFLPYLLMQRLIAISRITRVATAQIAATGLLSFFFILIKASFHKEFEFDF